MTDKFFGYTPEKMALARDFIKEGINKKSTDEIVECFNTLFNKNESVKGCSNCARNRYTKIIVNFLKNGEAVWKKHNLYEHVVSVDDLATDEDIDNLFKPAEEQEQEGHTTETEVETNTEQVDKPKRGRQSTKNKSGK